VLWYHYKKHAVNLYASGLQMPESLDNLFRSRAAQIDEPHKEETNRMRIQMRSVESGSKSRRSHLRHAGLGVLLGGRRCGCMVGRHAGVLPKQELADINLHAQACTTPCSKRRRMPASCRPSRYQTSRTMCTSTTMAGGRGKATLKRCARCDAHVMRCLSESAMACVGRMLQPPAWGSTVGRNSA